MNIFPIADFDLLSGIINIDIAIRCDINLPALKRVRNDFSYYIPHTRGRLIGQERNQHLLDQWGLSLWQCWLLDYIRGVVSELVYSI